MSNIAKKVISIVTILTVSVWLVGPGVAQAITVEELQAQINSLLATLAGLQTQLATLQGTTPSGTLPAVCSGVSSFDRNLSQGASGNDVKCLQGLLNQSSDTQVASSGAGSPGSETTFFGPLTKAAAVKYQEKYTAEILTPVGLSAGTGFVGPSTRAKLNSVLTSGAVEEEEEEEAPPTGAGENKVSLTADAPAASSVAKGALDVVFSKINFCAASAANTVSKIILTRAGIAADADIASVKLYEGSTQIGSTQALNTNTHKATFSSLNWTIPANSCKVLSVLSSIATGATQGNSPKFSIAAASDITSTTALDGVFPIISAAKTIAGISTGQLLVATTTPSGGTVVAGGVDESIAGFNFTSTSTEGVDITSIVLTEIGSSVDSDVSDIKLWYGTTQIGQTVASLTNGKATFDIPVGNFSLLSNQTKALKVTASIGTSVGIQNRTVGFEITDDTRLIAYGANSGGKLTVYGRNWGGNSVFPVNSVVTTVNLGTLTIAQDTGNSPASQDYSRGTNQNSLIAFKFTAGASEGARITQIKLTRSDANLADSDVSSITLYDAATGEQLKDTAGNLVPAAGMISGLVTFGSYTTGLDTTGLFDLAKAAFKTIIVKADVPSGASTGTAVLGFKINNPTTDIKADGLSSQNDLASTDINAGSATAIPSTVLEHNIIGQGTLTVQSSSNTAPASTYAVGTTDLVFASFDFVTTGEPITLSQLKILFSTSSVVTTTTTAAASIELNNVDILDGGAGGALLKTDPTLSSGQAEFGLDITIPKNTTKTLTVRADIPSGSTAAYLTAHIDSASYVTATGESSAQTITASAASWSVHGSLMTKGAPTLAVVPAQTPSARTYIKNTTDALMATLFLTANIAEDIKVSKIRITMDATTSPTISSFSNLADATDTEDGVVNFVGNLKLFEVGTTQETQIGTTMPSLTNANTKDYVDFSGLSLTVLKGTTKSINVKVNLLNSTGTEYFYFGVATASDITASGIQSGTTATITAKDGANQGASGKGMLFSASGVLAVSQPTTANSAVIIEGAAGQLAGSWKFTSVNEGINITKLVFDVVHSSAATGTSVSGSGATSSIDSYAAPNFQFSLNDGATTTQLSIDQLNQVIATDTISVLELTAGPHASTTAGRLVTISSAGAGTDPYIISAVNSNGSQSTTTVIGHVIIADADGFQIDIQSLSAIGTRISNATPTNATTAAATLNANGTTSISFGPEATMNLSGISAGDVLVIDDNGTIDGASTTYLIAMESGGAASTSIKVMGQASGSVYKNGQLYRDPTLADAFAAANSIAYNSADTGAEIASWISSTTDLRASFASNVYTVWATTSAAGSSIEITDASSSAASVADDLRIGLKHGGTEAIGLRAGNDNNVALVSLYDGTTKLADAYLGASRADRLEFGCDSCTTLTTVPVNGSKTLSLKINLSDYTNASSGSSIAFRLGTSTAASDTDYIFGNGLSSNATLSPATIYNGSGGSGAVGALTSNVMYLYATIPTVSLNPASPSGSQAPNSNGEVFRFDITVPAYGFDARVNAIRFTINSATTSPTWDKTYNLYESGDLSTIIASGQSFANATTTDTVGQVVMYPDPQLTISSGTKKTYILKGNTSALNVTTGVDPLTVSIEDGDFYWDDGLAPNANQKVLGLPVSSTITF